MQEVQKSSSTLQFLNYLFQSTKPIKAIYLLAVVFGIIISTSSTIILSNPTKILLALFSYFWFYGGIYIINDLCDYKNDINDPIKKKRVVASGKISRKVAGIFAFFIITISSLVMYLLSVNALLLLILLLLINLAYNLFFKKFPYLDSVFVNITNLIKISVGVVLFNSFFVLFSYLDFFAIFYLGTLGFAYEKKYRELEQKQSRVFYFGKYNQGVINKVQLLLIIPMFLVLINSSEFLTSLNTLIFALYVLLITLFHRNQKVRKKVGLLGENVSQGSRNLH